MTAAINGYLTITLCRGLVGKEQSQRRIVTALGLGKYGSSVVHADTPTIRGMVNKIKHLVTVTEGSDSERKTKRKTNKAEKNVVHN